MANGTYKISTFIYRDLESKDSKLLEEKLKYAQEFIKENNDVGVIRGILANIDAELVSDPTFIERILKITTDQKVVSDIVKNTSINAYKNPDFLEKILGACNDSQIIKTVLSHLDNEKLKSSDFMLKMIRICPNVLGVFKDEYSNYEAGYLFNNLKDNKEFQKGLFEICSELISQSEAKEEYIRIFQDPNSIMFRNGLKRGYVTYFFAKGSPMGEFVKKMNSDTEKLIIDITTNYFKDSQTQFSGYDIGKLNALAKTQDGIARAVLEANEIARKRKINLSDALKAALEGGITTETTSAAKDARNAPEATIIQKEEETK